MAPQPGGGTFIDSAAVPLADGRADDYSEEVRQAGGTARIYGMNLCKTEKFSGSFDGSRASAFRQYTVRYVRPEDGFNGWNTD